MNLVSAKQSHIFIQQLQHNLINVITYLYQKTVSYKK